jgi:hypothetical protein
MAIKKMILGDVDGWGRLGRIRFRWAGDGFGPNRRIH